jgi:DNA-binding NarL/FixJ family response regulator
MLSGGQERAVAERALAEGAAGYLEKGIEPRALARRLLEILRGDPSVQPAT